VSGQLSLWALPNIDPARGVARTILYEGYVLWPYRRSALKNQRRWTFGCVLPRAWSEDGHPDDAWRMRAECLLVGSGDETMVGARARFLQVVRRDVARLVDGALRPVDELEVDGERWMAWEEATEREIVAPPVEARLGAETSVPLEICAGSEREWLDNRAGERVGAVDRSWRTLRGELRVRCDGVAGGATRVSVELTNTTEWEGEEREDALRSALVSTHLVLRARHGAFASLTDPPDELAEAAALCQQEGCWPVLVGERGERSEMLASPIILPDYPAVAPESPGDLFDGGEIDELLSLHVLALSDREKEEMRATDPRTREILERTSALAEQQMLRLHGTRRDGTTGDPIASPIGTGADDPRTRRGGRAGQEIAPLHGRGLAEDAPDAFWREMGRPADQRIVVDGVTLGPGSRVRLHPEKGGDVMDVALAGRTAVVEGVDEDAAGGVHLTVVVEGDPGVDLGMSRMPGHRFFFRPEEVEPLTESGR
jgi:hypothetical protein